MTLSMALSCYLAGQSAVKGSLSIFGVKNIFLQTVPIKSVSVQTNACDRYRVTKFLQIYIKIQDFSSPLSQRMS